MLDEKPVDTADIMDIQPGAYDETIGDSLMITIGGKGAARVILIGFRTDDDRYSFLTRLRRIMLRSVSHRQMAIIHW